MEQRQQLGRDIQLLSLHERLDVIECRIVRYRDVLNLKAWREEAQMHIAQCDLTAYPTFKL